MVERVREEDLADLLPLVRSYCDFYEVAPSDEALLSLCRALLDGGDGVQLLARDDGGAAIGFATVFWTWSTLRAARIAVMNDLFVVEAARGTGVADALIAASRERARAHDAAWLGWQTARDNARAQAVYDRVGARAHAAEGRGSGSEWIDYGLRP